MVAGKLNTKRGRRGVHRRRERACVEKGGRGPGWNLGEGDRRTIAIIAEEEISNLK